MFKDKSIGEYCDLLAGKAAVPGGGSALPMVGAYACALCEMAVNVTLNKYGDGYEYADMLVANLKVLGMCRAKLYALSDDDSVAFGNILSAMRLPKDTEEQIAHRKSELQKQYHKSALVPLEVMQVCRRALDCAEKCKPYIYKYVASDSVIGADLLRTVIRNSVENVTANTSLIVDDNLRTRLDKEAESIVKGI